MVTLEPYGLPQSNLEVMVSSAGGGGGRGGGGGGRGGLRVPVNILQLFRTLSGLLRHLRNDERRRILLLRHVSPEQANQLISLTSDEATDDTSDWSRLGMDVRTLRSEYIERLLLSLNDPSYAALRKAWTQPVTEVEGLRSLISKNGVTMIATLDPRRLALELTGWSKDAPSSSWIESKAALREKVKAAKDKETANKKAAGRSQKKDEENSGPTDEEDTTILLRSGLKVGLGESEGTEDDILCMLSKGVAYVRANEVEPLVQMLYRNALLHLPDRVTKQPPIHVLVVDYSAIYGTDCQAVDTLYMCEDLGELLSFEDHQQFIGRLRRDGTAIYPSLEMLRKATLGIPSAEEEEERMTTDDVLPKKVLTLRDSVAALMNSCDSGNVSTSQLTAQLRAIKVRHGDAVSVAEVNAKLLVALLLSFDEEARPEKLFSLLEARLRQWGGVEPIKLLNLKKPEDQSLLISACREACVELPALIKATPRLLQFLYNEELIEDEAFLIWKAKDNNSGSISPFRSAINPLLDWIENADEESSDELT